MKKLFLVLVMVFAALGMAAQTHVASASFQYNSATIVELTLNVMAEPGSEIQVTGYACSIGSHYAEGRKRNEWLAAARAEALADTLTSLGFLVTMTEAYTINIPGSTYWSAEASTATPERDHYHSEDYPGHSDWDRTEQPSADSTYTHNDTLTQSTPSRNGEEKMSENKTNTPVSLPAVKREELTIPTPRRLLSVEEYTENQTCDCGFDETNFSAMYKWWRNTQTRLARGHYASEQREECIETCFSQAEAIMVSLGGKRKKSGAWRGPKVK